MSEKKTEEKIREDFERSKILIYYIDWILNVILPTNYCRNGFAIALVKLESEKFIGFHIMGYC